MLSTQNPLAACVCKPVDVGGTLRRNSNLMKMPVKALKQIWLLWVDGTQIQLRLRTMHRDFQVSPDGRVLNGTMYRSFDPNPSTWRYMGTSCQKSG